MRIPPNSDLAIRIRNILIAVAFMFGFWMALPLIRSFALMNHPKRLWL